MTQVGPHSFWSVNWRVGRLGLLVAPPACVVLTLLLFWLSRRIEDPMEGRWGKWASVQETEATEAVLAPLYGHGGQLTLGTEKVIRDRQALAELVRLLKRQPMTAQDRPEGHWYGREQLRVVVVTDTRGGEKEFGFAVGLWHGVAQFAMLWPPEADCNLRERGRFHRSRELHDFLQTLLADHPEMTWICAERPRHSP